MSSLDDSGLGFIRVSPCAIVAMRRAASASATVTLEFGTLVQAACVSITFDSSAPFAGGLGAAFLTEDSKREKVADGRRDFARVCLQRKMPRIEEANHCIGIVALERLGARRQEEWIVLPPHG